MKRFVLLIVFAMAGMMVLVSCATMEPKKSEEKISPVKQAQANTVQGADASSSMKQVLLNPKGFYMRWTCHGNSGISTVVFREDANDLVAVIDNSRNSRLLSCTSDAKFTDNGIIFNGCNVGSRDIPLTYDPGNKETPFKGSKGGACSSVELSPM
jgi:hypothetical protein